MREVRIDKERLRERVQVNRDNHRLIFERSVDGYREAVQRWFGQQMDRLRDGDDDFEVTFTGVRPEDHTEDYERVLEMLEMSEDDTILLSQEEFARYVRDDWGWKRLFTATTSSYIEPVAESARPKP